MVLNKGIPLVFDQWVYKPSSYRSGSFIFLNKEVKIESNNFNKINWDDERNGKLWAYNLNYMDYILQPDISKMEVFELIKSFVKFLPTIKNGLEPYPLALRGINWIKFLSNISNEDKSKYSSIITKEEVDSSLYAQYLILLDNIEYHLLGNHLLEDGFSLLFAAFYFQDESFYKKASKILFSELEEQILSDGAHFELSPMYHQILYDRLLDCINLVKNNRIFEDQDSLLDQMIQNAEGMKAWLKNITFTNGIIPLFNDSALGIAPSTESLLEYSESLGIYSKELSLSDSGYRRFNGENYECIVDAGEIGPDYIPGHAHADTFNFEMHVSGKPFIVDTGVSTYEKNQLRQEERGTAVHNTVIVNNTNQSDVWGGFRVGKRARIISFEEGEKYLYASHNGYENVGVVHQRKWEFSGSSISIKDNLLGKNAVTGVSKLHFNSGSKPIIKGKQIIINGVACIDIEGGTNINIEDYNLPIGYNVYCKAFSISIDFIREVSFKITIQK